MTTEETFALAVQNHQNNNLEKAENLYKDILRKEPKHFGAIFYLGTLFAQTSRFILAKKLLQNAVEIKPNYADGHNNLGATLKELGEYSKAIKCCERAIEIKPNYADAHNNIGAVLNILGEHKKAVKYFESAIKLKQNFVNAYINLGLAFQELGEVKKEINCFEKLSKIETNKGRSYQNLGRLYETLGDTKQAIKSYKNSIKYEPDNFLYYYHLSGIDKKILNLDLKNKIKKTIKNKKLNKKNTAFGNFLLSRYEFINKNFKNEFSYLIKGHSNFFESQGEKIKKDVDYWLRILPNSEKLFSIKDVDQNTYNILKPIFIVGVPRCGSTLVEKIITSGRQMIPSGEETTILSTLIKQKIIKKESLDSKLEDSQTKLFDKYKEKGLINEKSNYIFTDKTLDNFFYIPFIKKIFPQAKIINCKRTPISSIMSILKNNLPAIPWAHNLDHIFKYFDNYYETIKRYKKIFPDFIYEVDLEKLSTNPKIESQKLMKFCDLQWDEKCLKFYTRKDLISRTTSNMQIRKAIYKHSKQSNMHYKKFFGKYGKKYHWFN